MRKDKILAKENSNFKFKKSELIYCMGGVERKTKKYIHPYGLVAHTTHPPSHAKCYTLSIESLWHFKPIGGKHGDPAETITMTEFVIRFGDQQPYLVIEDTRKFQSEFVANGNNMNLVKILHPLYGLFWVEARYFSRNAKMTPM